MHIHIHIYIHTYTYTACVEPVCWTEAWPKVCHNACERGENCCVLRLDKVWASCFLPTWDPDKKKVLCACLCLSCAETPEQERPWPPQLEDLEMKSLTDLAASTMDELTGPPQPPAHVWGKHERNGHLPEPLDCPICVDKQGTIVKHAPNATPRLHTLNLDMGYWDEVNVDGKKHFVVAGIRVKHEDSYMVVRDFLPVENKSGLTVTKTVFQQVDQVNVCKKVQSFHGAQILQIFSDKATDFIKSLRLQHDREERMWLHHLHSNVCRMVLLNGWWT